jgi:5'-nucleotidase
MSKFMTLGFDLDDTCFDWVGKLIEESKKEIPELDFFHRDKQTEWDFSSNYPEEYRRKINAIWHRPGFYKDLPLIPGAVEIYKNLIELGHHVMFVSTPNKGPNAGHSYKEKYECLLENFGSDAAHSLTLTYDKTHIVCDYLVDDKPQIKGKKTPVFEHFVFDRNYPYNIGIPEERKINWDNFKTKIPNLF